MKQRDGRRPVSMLAPSRSAFALNMTGYAVSPQTTGCIAHGLSTNPTPAEHVVHMENSDMVSTNENRHVVYAEVLSGKRCVRPIGTCTHFRDAKVPRYKKIAKSLTAFDLHNQVHPFAADAHTG
jgi:hypothetical protein